MFLSLPPDVELTQLAATEELERRLVNDIMDIERKLKERVRSTKNPIEELSTSTHSADGSRSQPPPAEQPSVCQVFTEGFLVEAMKRVPQIDVEGLESLLVQAEDALIGNKIHTCAERIMSFIAEHTRQAAETGDLYMSMVEELNAITESTVDAPCRALKSQVRVIEAEIEKSSLDSESAMRIKQELSDRIAILTDELAAKTALISSKEERHDKLSAELEGLLKRNIELQTSIQTLEENIRGASAETELIRKMAQGKHGDGEIEFLFQKVQDLINARDRLTREIDRCRVYLRKL